MRTAVALLLALSALSSLAACDMDSYASNPEDRDTHMGAIKAASPPPTVSAPPAAPPAASH